MTTAVDPRHGHEDHDVRLVSVSWGERMECKTCRKVLAVWGPEDNLIPSEWTEYYRYEG